MRNRLIDEKPIIRKASLELLGTILSEENSIIWIIIDSFQIALSEADVLSITNCIKDNSMSVRKMALNITEKLLSTDPLNSLYQDLYIQVYIYN